MRQGQLEVEAKIAIADVAAVRARLAQLGARPRPGHEGRLFEDNVLLDTPDRALGRGRRVLRLRRAGSHATLTYKEPPAGRDGIDPAMKTMVERECGLDDPGEMAAILEALGYEPVYRYQKWREELLLGDATVTLDETPIGAFVEIEASPERVRAVAADLGYAGAPLLSQSYRALYEQHCRARGEPCGDMVFAEGERP